MSKTTRQGLEERQVAPLNLNVSAESFNVMTSDESNKEDAKSKFCFHLGSGCNSENRASMSGRVFVLGKDGKPLTPCKISKARKLMEGKQAKPVWNKFGEFGIQMLVDTRKETPKTVLGCDFGTKFEGYSLISGKENLLNVMWKLPDKKKLVRKLEERRTTQKANSSPHQIRDLEGDFLATKLKFKKMIRKIHLGRAPYNKGLPKEMQPMYGKHHSKKTKRKIALSKIGDKNPMKRLEVAEKHSKTMKRLYKEGRIKLNSGCFKKGNKSWNEGLTKETDKRLKKASINISKATLGKPKLKLRNIPKSKKHILNLSLSHIGLKQSKETIEKRVRKNKRLWANVKHKNKHLKQIMKGMKIKPNKPELFLDNLMKKNNLPFNYVGNGQVIIGGFNPDFLSKNPKQIIELFGDYWHNLPSYKKRDKRKLKTYSKYGYKTLVVWEHELEKPIQVINKIREFIG